MRLPLYVRRITESAMHRCTGFCIALMIDVERCIECMAYADPLREGKALVKKRRRRAVFSLRTKGAVSSVFIAFGRNSTDVLFHFTINFYNIRNSNNINIGFYNIKNAGKGKVKGERRNGIRNMYAKNRS